MLIKQPSTFVAIVMIILIMIHPPIRLASRQTEIAGSGEGEWKMKQISGLRLDLQCSLILPINILHLPPPVPPYLPVSMMPCPTPLLVMIATGKRDRVVTDHPSVGMRSVRILLSLVIVVIGTTELNFMEILTDITPLDRKVTTPDPMKEHTLKKFQFYLPLPPLILISSRSLPKDCPNPRNHPTLNHLQ